MRNYFENSCQLQNYEDEILKANWSHSNPTFLTFSWQVQNMMKLDFDNNKMKNVAINEKPIR